MSGTGLPPIHTDAGPFTMTAASAAVIRARVSREPVLLVGLSLGAQLALQVLADAPDPVGRAMVGLNLAAYAGPFVPPSRGNA